MKLIKVLIVDDSALVRQILTKGLSSDPMLEVIGAAPDVYVARNMIVELQPDVLTLDIEMPKMDGLEFLRRLMPQYPLPVVVVSSLTQHSKEITIQALEAGAVDFVSKPSADVASGLDKMMFELRSKIKLASTANVSHWKSRREELFTKIKTNKMQSALAESTDKVIAIGASTGGTEAIRKIIPQLPSSTSGIVITQHMPPDFTRIFSSRLDELSMMRVKEAEHGDRILTGQVLIAPGGYHMSVRRMGGQYKVFLDQNEKVNGHRPSVDVLFNSVAKYVGKNAFGVILTGMGADGALGLKAMHDAGAYTLGQDRPSSIVYGMPKVAYDMGGVDKQVSLDNMANEIMKFAHRK
ncbi:MAG: chemotaxis response regulator protein-glutamate methylesterase [Candidatus Kapabacteria bacterium]|nr:chemotaxis response regulator protein-glutamate methylesterase [Candidatus Kapabacteria bacterium]